MMLDGRRLLLIVLMVALVAACGRSNVVRRDGGAQAPRSAQPASGQAPSGASEAVVARGETLYGIAFRHGLDYREVARWNGIAAPFTIYPGQRLRLQPPGSQATASRPSAPSRPARGQSAARPAPAASGTPATGAAPAPAVQSGTPATSTRPSASGGTPVVASGPIGWRWPAEGQIVGRFAAGDPTRQGIDIAGQAGQEVRAAADGVVVYSGSGLVGYGELVIIKHSDEWLSAYGHNRRRLVEEGQSVSGGQQVAEMGRSGASRDMLHFEIRRNGRPVDPLQHLPQR